MSKRELKKYLHQLSKEQLEEQFIVVYDKFPAVRTYYNFVFHPKEDLLVREAKLKISNEFFPVNRKRPKLRRSVAMKYIKHFVSLGVDPFLVADVMLYALETALRYTSDKRIKPEVFYKGMLRLFGQTVAFLLEKEIYTDFADRVRHIKNEAVLQQWLYYQEFEKVMSRQDF